MSSPGTMRIQQILAQAGVASRRGSGRLIQEGRVTLGGQPITTPGVRIRLDQCPDLRIDGQRLPSLEERVYILLHKPDGFISSTADPQGRPTVLDLLPKGLPRLYPVGRLDFHTEGLLLLTNDGPLTQSLLHPRFHMPKSYEAKVKGVPRPFSLRLLCEGIKDKGEEMSASQAAIIRKGSKNAWLLIEICQGKYHQVHRMCKKIGHPVLKLKRVAFGPIKLGELPSGRWRRLKTREIDRLRKLVAQPPPPKKDTSND